MQDSSNINLITPPHDGNVPAWGLIGGAAAKGSITGKLFAATRLANDRPGLASPDSLGVQYGVIAADAG